MKSKKIAYESNATLGVVLKHHFLPNLRLVVPKELKLIKKCEFHIFHLNQLSQWPKITIRHEIPNIGFSQVKYKKFWKVTKTYAKYHQSFWNIAKYFT